jgi:uncharacterized protein
MTGSVQAVAGRSPAIARAVPFAIYIGFLIAGPLLAPLLPDERWLYVVHVSAVAAALLWFSRHYGELAGVAAIAPRNWALALLTGTLVFVVWINADLPWLSVGQQGGFNPGDDEGKFIWPLLLARLFGAAVVVPVMEELFWRSFILRWIDTTDFMHCSPASISLKALLVSSVLFGVEHPLWFAGVLAGLAYGWLYRQTGNLWLPIAAHACTNLLLGVWVVGTGNWQFW